MDPLSVSASIAGLVTLADLVFRATLSETKEILASVSRHKQTINIALAADSISKLSLCLSQQEVTGESIKDLQHNVKKILDIEIKISLDRKRTLRHPMTGLWLTESSDFEDWYSTPKARILCSGIPRAGKSVIAGAIVDECLQRTQTKPGTAVSCFFCTYRDPLTFTANNTLSSLCSQLALQDETAYGILE
ncbi:hypothetical protein NCS56_00485000 [Fusarium sp. Ph1]|nr:hypothetical protein NCS56_00485000 [Fusarium sp. Ph1]